MYKKYSFFLLDAFKRGISFVLPLFLTYIIVGWLLSIISKILFPLKVWIPFFLLVIPYIEIIYAFLLIALIGLVFEQVTIKKGISFIEKNILHKVPLIYPLYSGIKQILSLVLRKKNTSDEEAQQIAWVKIPYKNMYCLGFSTGILSKEIAPDQNQHYHCFFIPHTPNPITGYYVVAGETECIFTNLTRQEAMSLIISGGVVKPQR